MGSVEGKTTTTTASLWLIPLDDHEFTKTVQELISDTIPPNFPRDVEKFSPTPHVTLTSGIEAATYGGGDDATKAQAWLDGLALPEFKKEFNECVVELDHLEPGDQFFRKLVIEIEPTKNLVELAAACRSAVAAGGAGGGGEEQEEEAAQAKAKGGFEPHMSLMYSDISKQDVKAKLGLVELQLGWAFGSLFDCCGGMLCMGGTLVLVDTSKPIAEWKPIARREMPAVMWKMNRNLM